MRPYLFISIFLFSCTQSTPQPTGKNTASVNEHKNNENPYPLIKDISLPAGYSRVEVEQNSFGEWLRNADLKKDKTVYLYNGALKGNQSAQFAVLNISVGHEDLQQCADAVMRLRAEYLFANKKFNDISFSDNDGKQYRFSEPHTRPHFMSYLNTVFGKCGSASLSKQLKHTTLTDMEPGDVLIRGGFPGHAVIVMDVAQNKEGKKVYLLAQSYMPAQDIHVLVNPLNKALSPWYEVNEGNPVNTPEYDFEASELKRW